MRLNFLHSVSQCSGRKGHIFRQTAWTARLNPGNTSCRSFSLLSSHQNPNMKKSPFMATRSYNIIIPASSGGKQDGIATDYDPVLPTKEVQAEMDRLISTAYCEAKKIAEIVEKRRDLNSVNSSTSKPIVIKDDRASSGGKTNSDKKYLSRGVLDIQGEVNAAEKLLIMTSHEFFDKALSRQRDQESDGTDDVAVSLHCAFLSVINWLCSTLASLPARQSEEHDDVNFSSKIPAVASATLRSNESILLTYILQLSERSRDLNLPLSIPQFKTIATMISKHSPGMGGDVSIIILDLSSKVSQIFGEPSSQDKDESNPIKAEFFSEALKELIQRNLLRDAVMLLQGMESIHHIDHVDLQTGMELLNILKQMVDDAMAGPAASSSGFDETDAMELAMILQQPVMAELKHSRKALESYDAMGSLMDSQEEDDENDGDVDDETWDKIMEGDHEKDDDEANQLDAEQEQEYDGYTQDMQELNEIIKSISSPTADGAMKDEAVRIAKSILNKCNSAKAAKRDANVQMDRLTTDANMSNHSVDPLAMSARVHVDPTTGDVDNIEFVYNPSQVRTGMSNADKTKYKELHQEMINDLVYCRDEAWEIPDIVPQLEKWNGDRSLLFTKKYEMELVKEITEDDEYYDDNLAFDDDDEDDEKTTV